MENPNYRLETFSDGVFAIALTLLIIEIKVPHAEIISTNKGLWSALFHTWPSWLAFIISFITILISWVGHAHGFKLINKTTNKLVYANGLLLLSIIILPYFTRVLAEYIQTDTPKPAVTLYCAVSLMNSISWNIITHITLYPESLYKSNVNLNKIKSTYKFVSYGLWFYSFAVLVSIWWPIPAFILVALSHTAWLVLGINLKEGKMLT